LSHDAFLLREKAKAGRLKHSDKILEKFQGVNDGKIATYVCPNDFVDVVRDNIDHIAANYNSGDEQFGWYRILQLYQEITANDPEDIELMEFDDKNEQTRLVYGIVMIGSLNPLLVSPSYPTS
jgi:hypothetical protein